MRKLLVLSALAAMTLSAVGCENCRPFRRGALFGPAPEAICDPCVPCAPMGTVIPMAPCGSACTPPMMTAPPGTTYAPGPGG